MPGTPSQDDTEYEKWWDEKTSPGDKDKMKLAVADYLIAEEMNIMDLTHNIKSTKAIIPYIGKHVSRWKYFNIDNFNTNKHKAHEIWYNDCRNEIDRLKEKEK